MKRTLMVFFTVLSFSATGVYAELHDRGCGMIYDDVLNITWLRDTNYANTSGYDEDGSMNWYEAMEWVDQLDYGGYDDWRLPTSAGGAGYNITGGEMGHLYYVTLDNLGYTSSEGITPQSGWGFNNQGPFINAQTGLFDDYWSSTENSLDDTSAWNFRLGYGRQHTSYKIADDYRYAWAVRDGDVTPCVMYNLKGREYFPGISIGATTFGARFAGQILNPDGEAIGHFDTILNHQGGPIEQCEATNTIVYFKLKMNFFDGRRIVLVMPYGDTATADWDWDDAACPFGGRECDFYSVENRVPCGSDVNPEVSLVAEVSNIPLSKRRFGSRGFDEISGGILYGWLIHTPPIFPAVIGTFVAH